MEPTESFVKLDSQTLSYDAYLRVSELLKLQTPLSKPPEHDETLFIVIHQVYELWFKQILHEVELCCAELKRNYLIRVMHALKRINTIQKILIQQIDVLETMIPDDFAKFRDGINPASGFQSWQFRLVEFRLGLKEKAFLRFFSHDPSVSQRLAAALGEASLYDEFLAFLGRRGFTLPAELLQRDLSVPYVANENVTSIYETIYRNPGAHSELYLGLEAMLDIDQHFRLWRYRHVTMVERMIGGHAGTGGSSGAMYLRSTLDRRFFPEIWDVRNRLGSSYSKPQNT